MNPTITVSYRSQWLGTICSFVSETAKALGADEATRSALHLAAEETSLHIIEAIPHDELEDAFEVSCILHENGVEYVFKNIGPPINVEALPGYDRTAPEESIEGLRLFLARKMVDRLDFINLGRKGWRTRFFKELPSLMVKSANSGTETAPLTGQESVNTRMAAPEDAFDIVQMAYMNYRYSYTKEAFYFADQLEVELRAQRILSFIARAESGPIIGHFAFIHDANQPDIIEAGAVMIRPEYRRSRGLFSLMKTVVRYRNEHIDQRKIIMSKLVTAHTLSQKLAGSMGLKPLAFHVSTHPRARFMGLDTDEGRESNLYAVQLKDYTALQKIFVPAEHLEFSRELLQNLGAAVEVACDEAAPSANTANWASTYDATSFYGSLRANAYTTNFTESLRTEVYKLSQEKIETLSLYLPTHCPLPQNLNEELRRHFFFFCGYVFMAANRIAILYSRLTHQKFSFDEIQVHDPAAQKLKDYIADCHQKVAQPDVTSTQISH